MGEDPDEHPVMEVSRTTHSVSITKLQPGIKYICTITSSTRKGYGAPCTVTFFTKPTGNQCVCFWPILFKLNTVILGGGI